MRCDCDVVQLFRTEGSESRHGVRACAVARSGCGVSARRGAGAFAASDRAPRDVSMLLWSLVAVAGALAAAQLACAAVVTGSVHFTSTATMALQNARQVQSIMLTHHDVEQHALVGLVHDGDGLCTLIYVKFWV